MRDYSDMNWRKIITGLEVFTVIGGTIGLLFSAFFFMDNRHQHTTEAIVSNLELQYQLNDLDLKKDAETKAFYEDNRLIRNLDAAESQRLDYLNESIVAKTQKGEQLQEAIREIKLKE